MEEQIYIYKQLCSHYHRERELYDLKIPKFTDVQFLKLHQGLEPVRYCEYSDGSTDILKKRPILETGT